MENGTFSQNVPSLLHSLSETYLQAEKVTKSQKYELS